ncbi:zinc ribbon domain-containing protein [Microtetraspora niveoalba]|uniref:zinc ribbon domain-containing protein n=1 Tax=Microtetraspora niveoalba TaxID=46175 RepID=UPI00083597AE|nr:zinc ribbon domain-containing protein [Microtetraspora niveoalba]
MPSLHSLVAGLGALGMLALPLHPHPSGSTDRVTPGAVRVESASHVSITLLDDRSVIKQIVREYDTDLAEGSGFTVTPDGVVVTATGVVQASRDPRVYAANRVFSEYFKVKIPADFSRHTLDDADLNRRLQACYPPQGPNSTCIATVTTNVTVFPYLDPPLPAGLPAQILTTGASPAAPAVLKVTKGGEKQNLPTVPMAVSLGQSVVALDVISFAGRPSAKQPAKAETAHLDPPGTRTFKQEDRDKLAKLLKDGAAGGALIDDEKSEVVGLLAGDSGTPLTITPVDEIRTSLVAAGVTPRRGPVDVVYESALASYHNKLYAGAVPVLLQVLNLRPDHAVALDHLKVSRDKAGTAEDTGARTGPSPAPPAKESSAISPLLWLGGGALVLVVVAAGAVPAVLRRKRRSGAGRAADPHPVRNSGDARDPAHGGAMLSAGAGPGEPPVASWPPSATQVFDAPPFETPQFDAPFGTPFEAPSFDVPAPGTPVSSAPVSPGPVSPGPDAPGGEAAVPGTVPPFEARPAADPSPPHGQAQLKFCTQCGMRLGQGHRFCGFCGHPADPR